MPTASSFTFLFEWTHLVGSFNSLIHLVNQPVALALALILAVGGIAFVINSIKPSAASARPAPSHSDPSSQNTSLVIAFPRRWAMIW